MRSFDRFAFQKALDDRIEGQKDAAASMIFQSLMRQPHVWTCIERRNMSKGSCEAAESAAGAALRMARLNCYII